jgi:hypothetical protein
MAAGVLIVASAGALAANASARQAAVAFAESAMPAWTQSTDAAQPAHPLVAQVFFVDARGDQAARIRAQTERMDARARADWQQQQQQERMRQERGNGDQGGNWHGSRRG